MYSSAGPDRAYGNEMATSHFRSGTDAVRSQDAVWQHVKRPQWEANEVALELENKPALELNWPSSLSRLTDPAKSACGH